MGYGIGLIRNEAIPFGENDIRSGWNGIEMERAVRLRARLKLRPRGLPRSAREADEELRRE